MTDPFVKLSVYYYDDVVIASLDDAHEVMFTRGLAYLGKSKTRGFIMRSKVLELSRKTSLAAAVKIAERLCAPFGDFQGPWSKVDGGYQVRNWSHYQDQLDAIEERRRSDRERKNRQREATRMSRDLSRDMSRDVTGTEKEEEKERDAAAAAGRGGGSDLPPDLQVLRSRFREFTALAEVSWSNLRPDQVVEISALIAKHGDTQLLETAKRTARDAAMVQAFIPTWRDLAGPRLVTTDPAAHVLCADCLVPKSQHRGPAHDHPWTLERTAS